MKITVNTKKVRQVVNITDYVNDVLAKSKKESGICHLFLAHTTAAITTADLDPGTDEDILDAIGKIVPKLNYRHPHDPKHTPDHIASTIIGTDLTIPFENKKLVLGTWQKVVLIEFNGPKEREIILSIISSSF
ncbi:hypothetical protein A3A49_00625 [Candidatus Curtissbacteria bacterium RIFCSPLOWO2_01_FULL_38_11b]|uniref:Secondary thiamine-phosphate synthase enzyme n=1 Tax=Candidatus Curtissbacteria bacterium RIFCSPLOWO2_01_FULL_38_11b TaxID=1797725 RepID=A0A1F5H085_9BACT|nr:MAG: hypothetical protein A3A49_00625 [Candidatus Curtissbacteria bacterium RIFCSPLOWO2_01_FULL_38_11b]